MFHYNKLWQVVCQQTKKPESLSFEICVVLGHSLKTCCFKDIQQKTGFLGYKYQVLSVNNKSELNVVSVW